MYHIEEKKKGKKRRALKLKHQRITITTKFTKTLRMKELKSSNSQVSQSVPTSQQGYSPNKHFPQFLLIKKSKPAQI